MRKVSMKLQIFICQLFLTICFTSEPGSPVELPVNSCENLNVDKLNCFNVIVPGSRDRRVGSNKKLELSRNGPSQPTQFPTLPGENEPDQLAYKPMCVARMVRCLWEMLEKNQNFFLQCPVRSIRRLTRTNSKPLTALDASLRKKWFPPSPAFIHFCHFSRWDFSVQIVWMFSDVVSHVAWFSEFDCGFLVSLFGGFYVWVCVTWSVFCAAR